MVYVLEHTLKGSICLFKQMRLKSFMNVFIKAPCEGLYFDQMCSWINLGKFAQTDNINDRF